jgi:2-keto-4-pentenoate hydratase
VDKTCARLLCDARTKQVRLAELPEGVRPKTPEEAYRCQDILVQQLLDHYGGVGIGYKIACTNVTAQRQLNVDGPFHGRMMSAFCFDSPARGSPTRIDAGQFFMRVVEAEFAFRMARDLPPAPVGYSNAERSIEEVAAAVEGVLPGIEIVDSRFDDWTTIGAPSLIADNACHAAWVKGSLVRDWRGLDLAAQTVRLTVNGNLHREGSGRAVLGHPLNALAWLANQLSSQGRGLKAGQYVTTGVTMEVYMGQRGDQITADFGPLGIVSLAFE